MIIVKGDGNRAKQNFVATQNLRGQLDNTMQIPTCQTTHILHSLVFTLDVLEKSPSHSYSIP